MSNFEGGNVPESSELWGERFREALEEYGIPIVMEMGDRITFEALMEYTGKDEQFSDLSDSDKKQVMNALRSELGFDLAHKDKFFQKSYFMEGTPGSPGAGRIRVDVYKTDAEDVYIRRYIYSDGDVGWSLGPKDLEDEEEVK